MINFLNSRNDKLYKEDFDKDLARPLTFPKYELFPVRNWFRFVIKRT